MNTEILLKDVLAKETLRLNESNAKFVQYEAGLEGRIAVATNKEGKKKTEIKDEQFEKLGYQKVSDEEINNFKFPDFKRSKFTYYSISIETLKEMHS